MWRACAVILLILLSACGDVTSEQSSVPKPLGPSFVLAGEHSCGTGSVPAGQARHWSCGDTIFYKNDTSMPSGSGLPAEAWNSALAPAVTGLPRLVATSGSFPDLLITSSSPTGNPALTDWRGAVGFSGGKPSGINFANQQTVNGGTLAAVAHNEMMLVFGLNDNFDADGVSGVSDHCAFAIPPSGFGPCQHDIELVKWIYGIRGDQPSLSKHIVTQLRNLPTQLTLEVGDSVDVSLSSTSLRFDRANPDWCSVNPCEAYPATTANSQLFLTQPPGAPYTVSQVSNTTVRVKGVSTGSGTGKFRYASGVFEYTDHVANEAGSVAVTVNPAPYVPTGVLREFHFAGCSSQTISGSQYIYLRVRWMNGVPPAGVTSYIISSSTSIGGYKTPRTSGSISYDSVGVQRDTLPGIKVMPSNPPWYVWIRQGNKYSGTAWLLVSEPTPVETSEGCAL